MKFPIWEDPTQQGALRGALKDEALAELCDRKQPCLLATNYLSIESRFSEKSDKELHLRTTLSQDSARHTLAQRPLKLRFPWALAFYSGQTQLLGYDQGPQKRILRLALPEVLQVDEPREAYRLDYVGRCQGAISGSTGTILQVSLENISPLGAGLFSLAAIPSDGFQTGRILPLSLTLEGGPNLRMDARLIHLQGHYLGLKFEPAHDSNTALFEWMKPRIEEVKRRWLNRAEIRARAVREAKPKSAPSGVLLLSKDNQLGIRITEILEGVQPVRACSPFIAPFREALNEPPLLILLDAAGADLDDRHRLRGLFDALTPACPVMVLGRGGDSNQWRSLAAELKTNLYTQWNPNQPVFFRRLVQGIIQRQG